MHINIIHERKKSFECGICGNEYFRKIELDKHVSLVHDDGKKKYQNEMKNHTSGVHEKINF